MFNVYGTESIIISQNIIDNFALILYEKFSNACNYMCMCCIRDILDFQNESYFQHNHVFASKRTYFICLLSSFTYKYSTRTLHRNMQVWPWYSIIRSTFQGFVSYNEWQLIFTRHICRFNGSNILADPQEDMLPVFSCLSTVVYITQVSQYPSPNNQL